LKARVAKLFLALAAMPVAAADAYYRVDAAHFQRILENIDLYRDMPSDPIFIVTADCPPDDQATLLGSLLNELPDQEIAEGGLDGFLVLTKRNIECLAGLEVPEGATTVRLYLDVCRLERE
jgi:hypothetical protein